MLRTTIAASALALGASFFPTQVLAQAFVGGSIGHSDIEEEIAAGVIDSGPVDSKDTGWKVFGGYMFNRNLGLEVAYVDLGRTTYSGIYEGAPVTGGKIDVGGFNVGFIGSIPLSERFSLFGKIGLFIWEVEASDTTGGLPASARADGSDISFGVGLSYDFTRQLGLRAEWEMFQVEYVDASLLSIGLVWRF